MTSNAVTRRLQRLPRERRSPIERLWDLVQRLYREKPVPIPAPNSEA